MSLHQGALVGVGRELEGALGLGQRALKLGPHR